MLRSLFANAVSVTAVSVTAVSAIALSGAASGLDLPAEAPELTGSGEPQPLPPQDLAVLSDVSLPLTTFAPPLSLTNSLINPSTNPLGSLVPTDAYQLSYEPSALPECSGQAILEASNCAGDGEEPEEAKLHQLVNQYRAAYDLPPIPRSPSLDLLANRHVLDIALNIGQLTHAWSNCSYDPSDPTTLYCSSRAPQRLGTRYPGKAYENAHYNSRGATAASALRGWQNSPPHNALMINLNNWHNNEWKAMGIGIYKQYAVLWVGESRDPETSPIASSDPEIRQAALARPQPEPDRSPRRVFRLPSLRLRIP